MVKKIFVVGGGFMGSGIAQVAAMSGYEVVINDVSAELLEKSRAGIDKMLKKQVEKGKLRLDDKDASMARILLANDFKAAADCDMVIEAIVENTGVKKAVFTSLSGIVREDAVLATNTSSISIAEIASAVKNPERFVGMHFFSPVPFMKLLEIVKGIGTSQETVETAKAVGRTMGKVCIVAKDSPAFIVNRMLDPMINEAIGLVENGIATPGDIDAGMKYGCNHPMGPLELIDMIGIDVLLPVMEVMYSETGDPKYRPSGLLRNMVRMKWLGRKTGKGFYIYNADGTRAPNPDFDPATGA